MLVEYSMAAPGVGQSSDCQADDQAEAKPMNAEASKLQALRDALEPAVLTPAEDLLGLILPADARQQSEEPSVAAEATGMDEDEAPASEKSQSASPDFGQYRFGGFCVRSCDASGLAASSLQQVILLTESNMKVFYKRSPWGWDRRKKKQEMTHRSARYVLVCDEEADEIAAFCHFRFEFDDEDEPERPVLYCYELQVHPNYQRKGLGRHLMGLLDALALRFGLPCTMLTVFKRNTAARRFYEAIGYGLDATDPSLWGNRASYHILSKAMTGSGGSSERAVQDFLSCLCALRS
mmetsp:Transcript_5170/g.20625  ORF Transcript_5170/g.20625 Transcript_5170/m.20625 type:complete len:293 (+) Transcript_5170:214-1092(+)